MTKLKYLLLLLACLLMTTASAQRRKRATRPVEPNGPYLVLPYLKAFGMPHTEVDKLPEVRAHVKEVNDSHYPCYLIKNTADTYTNISYMPHNALDNPIITKPEVVTIDFALLHKRSTLEAAQRTILEEIPADWESVSLEEYNSRSGSSRSPILILDCGEDIPLRHQVHCYRLPAQAEEPRVYVFMRHIIKRKEGGRYPVRVFMTYRQELKATP